MENLKKYDEFINEGNILKTAALAGLMTLTSCHFGWVKKPDGKRDNNYSGHVKIEKIDVAPIRGFMKIYSYDKNGNHVIFTTDDNNFEIGDSLNVELKNGKGKAYPLNDPSNVENI